MVDRSRQRLALLVALMLNVNACSKPERVELHAEATAPASVAPLSATASASAAPVPASPDVVASGKHTSYLLSVDTHACAVTIAVNDVPLIEYDAASPHSVGEVIDPWIQSGTNSVTVQAGPQKAGATDPCARLAVLAVPEGGDQARALRVAERTVASTTGQTRATLDFVTVKSPCDLWVEAKRFDWNSEGQRELTELAKRSHQLFSQKKIEKLAELTAYRARDTARCLGKTPESGVNGQRSFFEAITAAPDFSAVPWSDKALVLEVVGNGRLVWMHRNDGKLLLQNGAGGGMDLYAARIQDGWRIVR